MKLRNYKAVFATACLAVTLTTVRATLITGDISFVGMANLNGPMESATAITGYASTTDSHGVTYASPYVLFGSQTGAYASVPARTEVAWSAFSFSQTSVDPLWTFTYNSVVYSFQATSVIVDEQTANSLDIRGSGIAHIDGYEDSIGSWSVTSTGGNAIFTFGAATSASGQAVPEVSFTACLLGASLAGLAILRKRCA